MGKDNQAYFVQRAAEELAAELATGTAAASAHRELALRYSLRQILPEPQSDDAVPIGQPKAAARSQSDTRKRA